MIHGVGAGTFGVEKKVAGDNIWGRCKDGGRLLIHLLDGTLDLVAVGVWSGMCDFDVEESKWSCHGLADGFRVGTKGEQAMSFSVVDGDLLFEAV